MQIIIILVIIWLINLIAKAVGGTVNIVKNCVLIILGICVIGIYFAFAYITIPVTILCLIIFGIRKLNRKLNGWEAQQKRRALNKAWMQKNAKEIDESVIDEIIYPHVETISILDSNAKDYKFSRYNLPYGRTNAFLNYFNKSVFAEEVYYYSAKPSKNRNEFREYGFVITRSGIYGSKQVKTSDGNYTVENMEISFSGIKSVEEQTDGIRINSIDPETYDDKTYVITDYFFEKSLLLNLLRIIEENGFGASMLANTVIDTAFVGRELKKTEEDFNKELLESKVKRDIENVALFTANNRAQTIYEEIGNKMDGEQGGGYAGEYLNNSFDRAVGRIVQGEEKIGGRQVKDGADRIVNGVIIQTKYHKNAKASIGDAFRDHQARYTYEQDNGTRKMMVIEVPRDQYSEALVEMQKRIDSGQVPNIEPGESAKTYVRKGWFTYAQAQNVALSGTVESIVVDAASGIASSIPSMCISAILVFSQAIHNGDSKEEAIKVSLSSCIPIGLAGATINALTMQLAGRKYMLIPFASPVINSNGKIINKIENPIFEYTENMANMIKNTNFAQSSVGQMLGLDQMGGKDFLQGTLTGMLVFGPDICKMLGGRISFDQLIKNSAISVGGLSGAKIGSNLGVGVGESVASSVVSAVGLGTKAGTILGPVGMVVGGAVGGMVAGSIGSMIVKATMDNLIEDDAEKMFQIFKEEFIDIIFISGLNKQEFEQVSDETVGNQELMTILEDMYQSGSYRMFATEYINASVIRVLASRPQITEEMIYQGAEELLISVDKDADSALDVTVCPRCHHEIRAGKKFCSNCGTRICPNCHHEIKEGKKFCSKCGTKVA